MATRREENLTHSPARSVDSQGEQEEEAEDTATSELNLGSFVKSVQTVIQAAVEEKLRQLDLREARVAEQRKALKKCLGDQDGAHRDVVVRVGTERFFTTTTTLGPRDSFLAVLAAASRARGEKEIFIPRDPRAFSYILEFLTYGRIFTEASPDTLELLKEEAKYYCLPELAKQIVESGRTESALLRLVVSPPRPQPLMSKGCVVSADDNGLITVDFPGVYEVLAHAAGNAPNGSPALTLTVNSTTVARCAASRNTTLSANLCEVLPLERGARLHVSSHFGNGSPNDVLANSLQIRRLGPLPQTTYRGCRVGHGRAAWAAAGNHGSGQDVVWNIPLSLGAPATSAVAGCGSPFSCAGSTVTVLITGVYHVAVNLCTKGNTNGDGGIALKVGGTVRAKVHLSRGGNYSSNLQLSEVLTLRAGETLSICNNFSSGTWNDGVGGPVGANQRFTLTLLQAQNV